MRRLAAVVLLPLLVAPAAYASRPSCRLVRDGKGDTGYGPWEAHVPFAEPALDIVSADVASDARWVTVAIRVADLGSAPSDGVYSLYFTGRSRYVLHAVVKDGQVEGRAALVTGVNETLGSWTEQDLLVDGRATVDLARDEVRVSLPVAALAAGGGLGARLTDLWAVTWHDRGVSPGDTAPRDASDQSRAETVYTVGGASCLKAGS